MAATAAARSLGKLKQQNVALFVCDLQVQQQRHASLFAARSAAD
jgi:hypothetical protein